MWFDLLLQFRSSCGDRHTDDAIDLIEEGSEQPRTEITGLEGVAVFRMRFVIYVVGECRGRAR